MFGTVFALKTFILAADSVDLLHHISSLFSSFCHHGHRLVFKVEEYEDWCLSFPNFFFYYV